MRHVHAVFGFEIGVTLSANSSVTLRYTRDKRALPYGNKFLDKIAINVAK